MRILVIEDEKQMADGIQAVLTHEGYETDVVYDGDTGLEYILSNIYDLILLDIMLPKKDGFEVLRQIRKKKMMVPVIMLTAKSMTEDKVKGLDLGADDYLTKPFASIELLARIRARIREHYGLEKGDECIRAYDLRLDPAAMCLFGEKSSIKLSNKEYRFMEYLMTNKGIILTRDMIIAKVWGLDDNAYYNSIEVYVSFLRKKMKFIGANAVIVTAKGTGYSLEERNDGSAS